MEKKDLLERIHHLQEKFAKVEPNLNLESKNTEIKALQESMSAPNFWDDPENAQKVSQKASHLEQFVKNWEAIKTSIAEFPELLEMSDGTELENDLEVLEKKFDSAETETFLSGPHDGKNVILSIHTGNGGQDAEDFSQMLMRMYLRFAETRGWKTQIMDESPSDVGLKSATIEISGPLAYGYLKSEHGVHRLIRLSPFNAKNLRQTSFSRIEILPEVENDAEIEVAESDIRVDVFRSSGAGGQSVNTTDSAVRITYLPLNIVVTCQNEKSQLQNKQSAMKVLKSRLLQLKLEQQAQEISDLKGDMMENSFGSQIRTYTLQPYKLVKDHRTDHEHQNPDKVFDGDLDGFVEAFLKQ
jgi:peptide chain release factor 2